MRFTRSLKVRREQPTGYGVTGRRPLKEWIWTMGIMAMSPTAPMLAADASAVRLSVPCFTEMYSSGRSLIGSGRRRSSRGATERSDEQSDRGRGPRRNGSSGAATGWSRGRNGVCHVGAGRRSTPRSARRRGFDGPARNHVTASPNMVEEEPASDHDQQCRVPQPGPMSLVSRCQPTRGTN